MIGIIVLLDVLVWRPVIAWADKFKFEQVESAVAARSAVLELLRRSGAFALLYRKVIRPAGERLTLTFARSAGKAFLPVPPVRPVKWRSWLGRAVALLGLGSLGYAGLRASLELAGFTGEEIGGIVRGASLPVFPGNG